MEQFKDDDKGYLKWIKDNSNGYVVNCTRQLSPNELTLHRADCQTIRRTPSKGKFWTKDYIKICSLDLSELQTWVREKIGGRLKYCPFCKP